MQSTKPMNYVHVTQYTIDTAVQSTEPTNYVLVAQYSISAAVLLCLVQLRADHHLPGQCS